MAKDNSESGNVVKTFQSPMGMEVRVFVRDGEPWFVGHDVAKTLGYARPADAVALHVDEEDKTSSVICRSGSQYKCKVILINESGVYSLIFSSKLSQAREFKRWVTAEVLPQIRKTGGYIPVTQEMSDMEIMARGMQIMQRTIEHKDHLLDVQSEVIAELQPKALFHDAVQGASDAIGMSELAKLISQNGVETGQRRLFQWMRDNGYLGRQREFWNMPMQRYIQQGLFTVQESVHTDEWGKTYTTRTPKVTGKGQTYFVKHICGGACPADTANASLNL